MHVHALGADFKERGGHGTPGIVQDFAQDPGVRQIDLDRGPVLTVRRDLDPGAGFEFRGGGGNVYSPPAVSC